MNTYYVIVYTLVFFVGVCIIEPNLLKWIELQFQWAGINVRRAILIVQFHPRNFITNWMIRRKFQKIIREHSQPKE
jgi:hypothetical protein